jgi:hypothetical protein
MQLKPGDYELRLAAADLDANIFGSRAFHLEVRQPRSNLLLTSSLVVSDTLAPVSAVEDRTVTPSKVQRERAARAFDPLVWKGFRVIPAVAPVFSASANVSLFMRVYQPPSDFVSQWQVTALLRDSSGHVVAGPSSLEAFDGGDGAERIATDISLMHTFDLRRCGLHEGEYVAELQFVHRQTKKHLSFADPMFVSKDAGK